MARRLREADAARNYGFEDLVMKELLQILGNLPREVRPVVEHGQQDSLNLQFMLEGVFNPINGVQQLRNAF